MTSSCYPQLWSGALTQYPLTKSRLYRTVTNQQEDGSRIVFADTNASVQTWELHYHGISDGERDILQSFFETQQGRFGTFLFCDPTGNLLGWSGSLLAPAWQRNSLLTITEGATDLTGKSGANRLLNTGAGPLSLGQTLGVPGDLICCFSFYARSDAPARLAVTRASGSESIETSVLTNAEWQRFWLAGSIPQSAGPSTFQILLQPNQSIELYGMQVDAQPAPSPYIPTIAGGGLFPDARFDMDVFDVTADALNQNSCSVRIIARLNG